MRDSAGFAPDFAGLAVTRGNAPGRTHASTLLTCIRAAGPISVSDLAAATGLNDTTVSQTLRYLRAARAVTPERDGRVIRYRLAAGPLTAQLDLHL